MSHANAALTPRHRLIVGQFVVDRGWPISGVAARFQVSWPTVKRWADRYRAGRPMQDHSRVACAEIRNDETALTATAVLVWAVEWFNARDVTVERVLSDNCGAYRSRL